jgi:DNA polymerase (family 10)
VAIPFDRTLEQFASLAAIRGDAAEAALFIRALALVREHQIVSDTDLGPLLDTEPADPIQRDIHQRLRHMYDAGAWILLESAIADLPADLRWLFESGAATIDQLAALYQALGVTSAADLAEAVERQAVRTVSGLDAAVESAVGAALPGLRASIRRVPLGRATALAEPLLAHLRAAPGVEWALPVGSLRRGQDTVGDIELIASAANPREAIDAIVHLPEAARCLHRSPRKLYLLIDAHQVGIRFPAPAAAGAALLVLTGSSDHVGRLKTLAARRGWHLNADGLLSADRSATVGTSEEEIYAALGLPFIPPEIRDGADELRAAEQGTLPTLVSQAHIRGDLHMHSSYSDGRDSVETMATRCRGLGYEYLAITDHSTHSPAPRNLTADGAKRQAEEIAALREQYPDIAILHGCEVEILPNGRLDFPDRILERFDLVLASLHEGAGQSPERLLRRYASAMRHPLVSVITHPTNRLIP